MARPFSLTALQLGAQVTGIDLTKEVSKEVIELIKQECHERVSQKMCRLQTRNTWCAPIDCLFSETSGTSHQNDTFRLVAGLERSSPHSTTIPPLHTEIFFVCPTTGKRAAQVVLDLSLTL